MDLSESYRAYVFPWKTYIFYRRANAYLDENNLRVTLRNGTTVFESPLTAIAGAQVEALAEGKVPYVLLKGRQLDEVRLGFTPTLVRNLIVVAGLFVSAPAAMAVIHNYTYASDGALLWGAVIAFLFTYILAEKTLQPGDGTCVR